SPGGPREILGGGDHGLLVPAGDPEALADALDRLTADEGLRQRLSLAALKRSRDYDPDHIYDLWKRTIRQATATGAASTGTAGDGPAGKGPAEALPAADPASGDRPMRVMRVMLVSESLWGGTGRVISWLASRLA